jgi:hypothetical protein
LDILHLYQAEDEWEMNRERIFIISDRFHPAGGSRSRAPGAREGRRIDTERADELLFVRDNNGASLVYTQGVV